MFNGRLFHRRGPLYFITDVRPISFVHRGIVKPLRSLSRLLQFLGKMGSEYFRAFTIEYLVHLG